MDDLVQDLMRQVEAEKALSKRLEDYVDGWVAVRDHEVVAHAATLAKLLEQVDTDEIDGVLQVVEQGAACFF